MSDNNNEKEVSKFVSQLQRSNSKIRKERAERIGESVGRAQKKLIMDIQDAIDKKKNKLEAMMDLSTDNQRTSMNVVSDDFDASGFVSEINELKTEIKMKEIELKIAEDTEQEWFQ